MSKKKKSLIDTLHSKDLIKPPYFLLGSVQYEVIMGSMAYGVSNESSDIDVYGFCIPPKSIVFPHLDGYIPGFGKKPQGFEVFQQHHILDKSARKEYDVSIYNIVKYFDLCMQNNPNMIDSLFVPQNCFISSTKIGDMVRDSRKDFLHKGSWHKFKGYAFQQMRKMLVKEPNIDSKRYEMVSKYGYDVKFAYHVVRLLGEVEQILLEGDLDLQRNKEQLKAIRSGMWSLEEIQKYFYEKEKSLENLYQSNKLDYAPDEKKIKALLLRCLEEYYGSLENCVVSEETIIKALRDIAEIINNNRRFLK